MTILFRTIYYYIFNSDTRKITVILCNIKIWIIIENIENIQLFT